MISIITICYNSERHIEQTIKSVVDQTSSDIEYIIIDGGSTDGTLEIVRKYQQHIDKWTSEPDEGIADAMNKGLSLATGDYILFLHSDDYLLHPGVIEEVAKHLDGKQEIVLFDIYLEKDEDRFLCKPRGFNYWSNFKTGVYHQSVFCKRELFDIIGNFDTGFRIAMDYDFFLRAYRKKIKEQYINYPTTLMRLTGLSSKLDWPSLKERFLEEKRVHYKNCPNIFMNIIYQTYWPLYLLYRKVKYYIIKFKYSHIQYLS